MKGGSALFSALSCHWNTPEVVLEVVRAMGPIRLDPCSNKSSIVRAQVELSRIDDGLSHSWLSDAPGLVYFNPPYGREIGDWTEKAAQAARDGAEEIGLLPARTDLAWFQEHILQVASAILFWRGRIKFLGAINSAPFPSILAYFGRRPRTFRQCARRHGRIVLLDG